MVGNISRVELIRRTAGKCGVPDSESKVFFDIFLVLLSGKLSPGDRLFINDSGYFYFNKALMRSPAKINKEFSIVLFSTEIKESPSLKDHLLFNIPAADDEDLFRKPDQYFSLSIGKPVIPLKGSKYSEFVLPPGGSELRHLLYSKAEQLINESEIIRAASEVSPVIIPFGEKHDIVDIRRSEERESLTEIEDPPVSGAGSVSPEPLKDKFPSVKKIHYLDEVTPDIVPEGIAETKHETPKFEQVKPAAALKDSEPVKQGPPGIKGVFPLPEETGSKSTENLKSLSRDDKKKLPDRKRHAENDAEVDKNYKGRRSRARIFVLAGLLVLSVTAALIYYSPLFQGAAPDVIVAGPKVVPVIIERTYEIPVTYPYDTSVNLSGFTFDPIALVPEKISQEEAQNSPPEVKQESVKELSADGPVKIKDNIFRYGEFFVVQLSSWRSLTKAKSEVERLNSSGLNAFLEEARLISKDIYYRVRVGNFKSLSEAEDFLKKNI